MYLSNEFKQTVHLSLPSNGGCNIESLIRIQTQSLFLQLKWHMNWWCFNRSPGQWIKTFLSFTTLVWIRKFYSAQSIPQPWKKAGDNNRSLHINHPFGTCSQAERGLSVSCFKGLHFPSFQRSLCSLVPSIKGGEGSYFWPCRYVTTEVTI